MRPELKREGYIIFTFLLIVFAGCISQSTITCILSDSNLKGISINECIEQKNTGIIEGETKIADIIKDPQVYKGKQVTIIGTVDTLPTIIVKPSDLPGIKTEFYLLRNNNEFIWIMTDKKIPRIGEKLKVTGKVIPGVKLGGGLEDVKIPGVKIDASNIGTTISESKREYITPIP